MFDVWSKMEQQILGDKRKRRYDEGLIDVVNEQYKDLPTSSPASLEPYYEMILKNPNESYDFWNARMQKLEVQIKEWPELRRANGEDKSRVWEVKPGQFGFHVDHDEIKRHLAEEKLLEKIQQLREEYRNSLEFVV